MRLLILTILFFINPVIWFIVCMLWKPDGGDNGLRGEVIEVIAITLATLLVIGVLVAIPS